MAIVFWNLEGLGLSVDTPTMEPRTCFIRFLPTKPELLLARPFGYLSLAERSNKAEEFTAPHDTTTMSPVNTTCSPFTSATTPVTSRPLALVCNRKTLASVSRVMFGSHITGRTASTSASDFAWTMQG